MHKILRVVSLGLIPDGSESSSSTSTATTNAQQEASKAQTTAEQNQEQVENKERQNYANLDALLSADTLDANSTTLTNPQGLTTQNDQLERNSVLGG